MELSVYLEFSQGVPVFNVDSKILNVGYYASSATEQQKQPEHTMLLLLKLLCAKLRVFQPFLTVRAFHCHWSCHLHPSCTTISQRSTSNDNVSGTPGEDPQCTVQKQGPRPSVRKVSTEQTRSFRDFSWLRGREAGEHFQIYQTRKWPRTLHFLDFPNLIFIFLPHLFLKNLLFFELLPTYAVITPIVQQWLKHLFIPEAK